MFKKIFAEAPTLTENSELIEKDLTVAADSFLLSGEWKGFVQWRELKQQIKRATHQKKDLNNEQSTIERFIQFNPEFWETYQLLAEYFNAKGDKSSERKYFESALTKEINDTHEADKIRKKL